MRIRCAVRSWTFKHTLLFPWHALQAGLASSPELDGVVMYSSDKPHPLSVGREQCVAEKAANVNGCVIFFDIEPNKAVVAVAKCWSKKIVVAREKGDMSKPV